MAVLQNDFYRQDALIVAPALLGKILVHDRGGDILRLRITETECYRGEEDTACHAKSGRTARTAVLYHPGGCTYIYLCYGLHYLLNIVTGEEDHPEAVLIRGGLLLPEEKNLNGPAKLTRAMGIDKSLNNTPLTGGALYIEDDGFIPQYITAPRVGIDYATEYYRDIHWRFICT